MSETGAAVAPAVPRRGARRLPLPSPRWFVSRFVSGVIGIWGALTLVFFTLEQMGAPIAMFVRDGATQEEMRRVIELMGYDRPPLERYLTFMASVISADFPTSLQFHRSPIEVILERIPSTALLAATALALGCAIGMTLGYVSAFSRLRALRTAIDWIFGFFQSVPTFFLALLLIFLFAVILGWLPASGSSRPVHIVLPALTLSLSVAIPVGRVFRTALLGVSASDYVRTARSAGRRETDIRLRHMVPNAFLPVLTVLGMHCANLFGGAAVTESIFRWPGVGQLLVTSAATQDYPMVLATVCFAVIVFIGVNLVIDLLYTLVDPRVRLT